MPTGRSGPADDVAGTDPGRQGDPPGLWMWDEEATPCGRDPRGDPVIRAHPIGEPDWPGRSTRQHRSRTTTSGEPDARSRANRGREPRDPGPHPSQLRQTGFDALPRGAAGAHRPGPGRHRPAAPAGADPAARLLPRRGDHRDRRQRRRLRRVHRLSRGHRGAHGGVQGQPPRAGSRRPARGERNGPEVRAHADDLPVRGVRDPVHRAVLVAAGQQTLIRVAA